ncbi:MAG: S-layer homology domain-containing protein [Oscillospiraceae bacterium]|nr:S-layer homology domain-containing protein [Oscillospiraceae bacterium]
MKKILIILTAVVMLVCAPVLTASAANYNYHAEQLNALGLFKGTGSGYDLERAPNRAEGVTMLVRLLGLETEAEGGAYEHPFSDVPAWADDNVALAYEKGFTTGTTTETFGPGGLCTAQMYVTFVLRALGYSDADASSGVLYDEALDFGKKIGIVDSALLSGDFLRGEMTAVSYLALTTATKGGQYGTLLEKLVDEGAVTAEAAAGLLGRIAMYNEIFGGAAGAEGLNALAAIADIALDITMMSNKNTIEGEAYISLIMTETGVVASIAVEMATDEEGAEGTTLSIYVADECAYIDSGDSKTKMSLESLIGEESAGSIAGEASLNPFYWIESISKSSQGGVTTYTVEIVKGFADDMINSALSEALAGDGVADMLGSMNLGEMSLMVPLLSTMKVSTDALVMKFSVDADGMIVGLELDFGLGAKMPLVPLPLLALTLKLTVDVTDYGEGIVIEAPEDLDEYVEGEGFSLGSLMGAMGGLSGPSEVTDEG